MIVLCVGGPNHGEEVAVEGGRGLEVVRFLPGRPTYEVLSAADLSRPSLSPMPYERGFYDFAPIWQLPDRAVQLVAGLWQGWPSDRLAWHTRSMHTETRNQPIDRIYVHTNEGPQVEGAAHALAGYLSRIDAGYHVVVDDQGFVRCADDHQVVWAEGGDNSRCLSICLIGYSASTDWTSEYSKAEILNAAHQVATWCLSYNIPVRHVTPGAPGQTPTERGIAEHADDHSPASQGHTDPGPRFPIDNFIALVQSIAHPAINWQALEQLVAWSKRCAETPLKLGMNGADVKTLNDLLAHHGYANVLGSAYGVHTVAAVADFKVKAGDPNHDGTVFGGTAAELILKA